MENKRMILIPCKMPEQTLQAIEWYNKWFKGTNDTVIFLHVFSQDKPAILKGNTEFNKTIANNFNTMQEMRTFIDEVSEKLHISNDVMERHGKPSKCIVDVVKELNVHSIIFSPPEDRNLGDTITSVLNNAKCSIIVVKS